MLFLHTFFNTLIFLKKGEKKCEKLFPQYTTECCSYNNKAYKAVFVAISTQTFLQGSQYFLCWWQLCYRGVEGGGLLLVSHKCECLTFKDKQEQYSPLLIQLNTLLYIKMKQNILLNIDQMFLLNINQKFSSDC